MFEFIGHKTENVLVIKSSFQNKKAAHEWGSPGIRFMFKRFYWATFSSA